MDKQVATVMAGAGVMFGLVVIAVIVVVVLAVAKPGIFSGGGNMLPGGRIAFTNKGGCDSCPYAR